MMRYLPLLFALVGCGAEMGVERLEQPMDNGMVIESDLGRLVYVDIHPSDLFVPGSTTDFRVLPQTIGPLDPADGLDGVIISLETPTSVDGMITADVVTPQAAGAELPFEFGPISAQIVVTHSARTVQNYSATTAEDGFFYTDLVAGGYDIFVVPDNPVVPVVAHHEAIAANGATLDFQIEQGAAIWGQVRYPGADGPFHVHVVDGKGIQTSTAETDDDGYYLIRVMPEQGPFTVVCLGRDDGRDPSLTSEPIDPAAQITDTGLDNEFLSAQVDFEYPPYDPKLVSGRVLDENDEAIKDVAVRFTATELTDYGALDASLQITRNADGNFDASLPAGHYIVEFMSEGAHSPGQSEVTVSSDTDLGEISLDPLTPVTGVVRDQNDRRVGLAKVSCTEVGFGERSWSTYADEKGNYALDLPNTNIVCTLTPPNSRDHALTRQEVDGTTLDGGNLDLVLSTGTLIRGAVDLDGEAEAYAVVEFRDHLGRLFGSTATDEEGSFRMQIDLPPVEDTQ